MRLYRDQDHQCGRRWNRANTPATCARQTRWSVLLAKEHLKFRPASGYNYSDEHRASKVRSWNKRQPTSADVDMSTKKISIGFVRRGYSQTGGAESYLKRLARGIVEAGHDVQLITTNKWPRTEWPFGAIRRMQSASAIGFADEFEQMRPQLRCDLLVSLERLWGCDVYRAGDGVHRAWLARKRTFEMPLERFVRGLNHKHRDILQLEKALFVNRGARRVIVNSQMIKSEIVDLYGYPAEKIDLARNGDRLEQFRFDLQPRAR